VSARDADGPRSAALTHALRIGVDATFRLYGGSLTHLRALLAAWRRASVTHTILLFAAPQNLGVLADCAGPNVELLPQRLPASRAGRLLWFHAAFPAAIAAAAPDVMLFPGGYMPARPIRPPSVVIFRNAAPFCESTMSAQTAVGDRLGFVLLGQQMRLSASRAARQIFPSRYLLEIFSARYGVAESRVRVLYHGRDTDTDRPSSAAEVVDGSQPFVLCISHLYRYKNVTQLIEGYHRALPAVGSRRLVIAGDFPDPLYAREVRALVDRLRLSERIVLTGGVDGARLAALIEQCDFFVFPSTCENCPNTLIEVMAHGKAIAASNKASMPEMCGDAALYFDPNDPAAIAGALGELAANGARRVEFEVRARQRARTFPDWNEVALQTLREVERAWEESQGADRTVEQ
jgi:glycosyltransferase involved in cell wall biosynthesis